MSKHPFSDFRIIQFIQQLPPLQILPKSVLRPEDRSSRKTPPLGHRGSPTVSETLEPLNPSSSDRLSPISVVSYATQSSLTFIMCHTLQSGQLWTKVDLPACTPNSQASVITTVTINQHVQIVHLRKSRPYHPSMHTDQRHKYTFSSNEKRTFGSFSFQLSSVLRLWQTIPVISVTCKLQWIILPLLVIFSD